MDPKRRRLRSRLNREILALASAHVAAPLLAAELYRLLSLATLRTAGDFLRVVEGRQHFYVYLHRLARRGLIRLEGTRRRKRIVLTPQGEEALREIERESPLPGRAEDARLGRKLKKLERQVSPMSPEDRFHQIRRELARLTGPGGAQAVFISYDIPETRRTARVHFGRKLRELGFVQVNGSFYVGSRPRLKIALGVMEDLELLPYACWGTFRLLAP